MIVDHSRQSALRGLRLAHVLAAILGGIATAAAIAEIKWIAAAAAILVIILQIHSLEILRTTLLADGQTRR